VPLAPTNGRKLPALVFRFSQTRPENFRRMTIASVPASSPDAKSCAACHGENASGIAGAASRYPAIDPKTGALFNMEARINACRTRHQSASPYAYESKELIGLTAFLTHQSRGLPRSVVVDGQAAPYFAQGRKFYTTRQGQLNLSCAQCHDTSVGLKLRGDTISQGQTHGWPAYRLEWQSAGSLHRRLRACSLGVRAEILDYGSPDYVALELYLAWRGGDLPIEAPGVRR
jgi:L-cysteine S-thiosulfotransferase